MKKINYRDVLTKIEDYDGYVTKINSINDNIKNIVIEAKLYNYKVNEYDNYMSLILTLKDKTGIIKGLIVGNKDNVKKIIKNLESHKYYLIKGDAVVPDEESIKMYQLDEKINRVLCIKAIEKEEAELKKLLDSFDKSNVDEFESILYKIVDTEFFLPFHNNNLILKENDLNEIYIPLFTSYDELSEVPKCNRLDKVDIETIIRDIYDKGEYHAITINPDTDDFILVDRIIDILKKIINKNKV